MDSRRRFIRRIELVHVTIAAVACAVAGVTSSASVVMGVALGALLGGLNFRALAVLATRMTATDGDAATRSGSAALIILKMLAMMAAVGAVLVWIRPDGIGFIIGLSLAPLALLVGSFALLRDANKDTSAVEVRR